MALQRHLVQLFFTIFMISFISRYILCLANYHDPPYSNNNYYTDETYDEYGYDSQAYPSYLSSVQDGNSKDLIKLRIQILSLKNVGSFSKRVKIINVDDFGAKADGNDDTQAFKQAWKEACSGTGTVIVVPYGKIYRLKPVRFSGPCKANLTVQIYGTIEASDDQSDYKKDGRHWIVFDSVQNLQVEGGGTINGNGKIWWQNSCKVNKSLPCKGAPTALTFYKSNNLVVNNLKIKDAQQMHLSFQKCKNVVASNLMVTAPGDSPNTDGIHITATQKIRITSSTIGTGDDCISIVSGSKNVQAQDITCGPGHGISIGSLGAEKSKACVSGVTVDGAKLCGTKNGVRIKTWQGGSGYASDIKFENIDMFNVTNPIIIDQNYCDQDKPCKKQSSAVQVKNVVYKNIMGTSASVEAVKLDCSKSFPCEGIMLQNVKLQSEDEDEDETKAVCNNVDDLVQIGFVSPRCP